jgi:hypothetical protein
MAQSERLSPDVTVAARRHYSLRAAVFKISRRLGSSAGNAGRLHQGESRVPTEERAGFPPRREQGSSVQPGTRERSACEAPHWNEQWA